MSITNKGVIFSDSGLELPRKTNLNKYLLKIAESLHYVSEHAPKLMT